MEKQQTRRVLYDVSDPTFWSLVQRQGILYTDAPLYLGQNGICLFRKAEKCEKHELDLFLSGSEITYLETVSHAYPRTVRIHFMGVSRHLDVIVLARDPAHVTYGRNLCLVRIGHYFQRDRYEIDAYVAYDQTSPCDVSITIEQTFYPSGKREQHVGYIPTTYAKQLVASPPTVKIKERKDPRHGYTHMILRVFPDRWHSKVMSDKETIALEFPSEIKPEHLLDALTKLTQTPEFIIQTHKMDQ